MRGQNNNKKEFLSQSELDSLLDEKKELEVSLREVESGTGSGTRGSETDVSRIKAQIKRIEMAIEERTPNNVRGAEKDKLALEEKELEKLIAEGMPTQYEMHHPAKCPGAVRKHLAWNARNKERIERYVRIQRILRPMEPNSIESLRKEK